MNKQKKWIKHYTESSFLLALVYDDVHIWTYKNKCYKKGLNSAASSNDIFEILIIKIWKLLNIFFNIKSYMWFPRIPNKFFLRKIVYAKIFWYICVWSWIIKIYS